MQVVIAGTARPIPSGMSRKAGSIPGYRAPSPSAQSRAKPLAPTSAPQIIGTREPIRPVIRPLARLETVKLAVSGRKARPAARAEYRSTFCR